MQQILAGKLAILADAARYDASCASSGTSQRNSMGDRGIGSTEGSGICHSYAPDGRCSAARAMLRRLPGLGLKAATRRRAQHIA